LRHFLVPIHMLATGWCDTLRALLRKFGAGPSPQEGPTADFVRHYEALLGSLQPGDFLHELKSAIGQTKIPATNSFWAGYYARDIALHHEGDWDYKRRIVARSLEIVKPKTVIDIGANTGWYSLLAARKGAEVTVIENDETCAHRLYERARTESAAVLTLVASFFDPTPTLGLTGQVPRLADRVRSEMVMALALSHHLSLGLGLSFQQIAQGLADFSSRALLVEFVPFSKDAQNPYRADCRPEMDQWYSLERFTSSLGHFFTDVVVIPGPPGGRILIACEK